MTTTSVSEVPEPPDVRCGGLCTGLSTVAALCTQAVCRCGSPAVRQNMRCGGLCACLSTVVALCTQAVCRCGSPAVRHGSSGRAMCVLSFVASLQQLQS